MASVDALPRLKPHVKAVLAKAADEIVSTKDLRLALEAHLGLPRDALKPRKKEIKRALERYLERQQNGSGSTAAAAAAAASAPPAARQPALHEQSPPPPPPPLARALFCDACGSLLDEPTHSNTAVECEACGAQAPARRFEALTVRTKGREYATTDGSERTETSKARATIQEACPKCNHPELSFYTMQLRSADEGQTVFYECSQCGHTYSTNT